MPTFVRRDEAENTSRPLTVSMTGTTTDQPCSAHDRLAKAVPDSDSAEPNA
jgi:hypothetical protein